jgi:hypothetical protein
MLSSMGWIPTKDVNGSLLTFIELKLMGNTVELSESRT